MKILMVVVRLKINLINLDKHFLRSQHGVVLPMLALTIPVLLLIVGLVATILHQRAITASLQTISDIAAKAGSAAACSTRECFQDSRTIAMNLIENHFLQTTGTLNRDETVSSWNIGDNTVTIQRGRWLDGRGFEAFENSWQLANPGIPAFAAYNAVNVQIQRNNILSIFPALLEGSLTSQVQATAVARRPASAERVPPFAIPICSLLNDEGNFDKTTVCDADRLFTESNRYCPPGNPNCNIIPDFSYSPFTYTDMPVNDVSRIYNHDPNVILQDLSGGLSIMGCSYFSQQYPRAAQNFGVVGMVPNSLSDPERKIVTREEVEAVLDSVEGKQNNVAIGDPFAILDEGLTTQQAGIRVEELQDNPLGNRSEYVDFAGSVGWEIINFLNMSFIGMQERGGCDGNSITGIARRQTFGVCRSTRNHWGRPINIDGSIRVDGMWRRFLNFIGESGPLNMDQGVINPKKMWKVRLPVIAEAGSSGRPCMGLQGSTIDPLPSTRSDETTFQIIGFITSYIYDSDIGEGPAKFPPVPLKAKCNQPDNPEGINRVVDSTFIGKYTCGPFGADTPEDATHPFGFRPDPSSPAQSCNVVRSRLDCNSSLFPGAEDRYDNDPYLVN